MLSTINFEDEVGNYYIQKLKWIKTMPDSRKKKIKKIYYHNPDKEEDTNKITNLFRNVKFINTNKSVNKLLTNYISEYDLIIVNDFKDEINRDFLINHIKNLSRSGKIWIYSDGLSILNKILEELENELNLKLKLKRFSSKESIIENELDKLEINFFKTKVDYMYNLHNNLIDYIFSKNYLPLEIKLVIKNKILSNYEGYVKLCFYIYIIG
jgi:hypothetical protein